mmetsp:Transcript_29040/g.66780  ORF Transcript_29040/g.66780 Transcript_29040/m.66780 type:complete len:417 (+) Transcript_29040:67-1317(+)
MWRTLLLLSLWPLTAAITMDAALLKQIPDAAAMKRMCNTVKSIVDSTAPKEVTDASGEYEKFVEQAKPVCKEVETMTDKDLEKYLKEQHAATKGMAKEILKQRCTEIKKAKGTPRMKVLEKQEWYSEFAQLCTLVDEHPDQLEVVLQQVEATAAEGLPEIIEDQKDEMEEFFGEDEETMARGCKMIESGLKNGRLDWFEMEAWYPKALALCAEYKEAMDNINITEDDLEDMPDMAEVLQEWCAQIEDNEEDVKALLMESQDWIDKAKPVCKQIEDMETDDIAEWMKTNKPAMKLLGAAQLIQMCNSVKESSDAAQGLAWFVSSNSVCGKVGGLSHEKVPETLHKIATNKVNGFGDAIANRCKALEGLSAEQLAKAKKEDWYEGAKAACVKFSTAQAAAAISSAVTQRLLRGVDVYA